MERAHQLLKREESSCGNSKKDCEKINSRLVKLGLIQQGECLFRQQA